MKIKITGLIVLLAIPVTFLTAQNYTQTIRGTVIDQDAQIPLIGATVIILETSPPVGTITDENGEFVLKGIPVGRQGISVSYVGYKPKIIQNLLLKSGKEIIITVELEENIQELQEVVIKANGGKEKPINDMAVISARSFSVEETERYAGSWGDPSRMAANFAGVSVPSDQRNDIIIRGNSPLGLIWQLEGIPIPNPNHFDMLGSTGGPVSILNNNLLNRSDFYTSAFPAEFGNGISGVFDLKMRNGNNQKREYVAQLGFNGFELGAEGPFNKGSNSSYLINYRYSMLGLVADLLWVESLPYYQDLSFKFNMPYKKGRFSIFGIGGLSHIEFDYEDEYKTTEQTTYEIIEKPKSKTGVIGFQHVHFLSENTRIESSIAMSTRQSFYGEDSAENGTENLNLFNFKSTLNNILFSSKVISKINTKNKIDIGFTIQDMSLNQYVKSYDSYIIGNNTYVTLYQPYENDDKNRVLLNAYSQWKHRFTNNLLLTSGIHYQHFFYNNTWSFEPRAGLKWNFTKKQSVSAGYGLHGQIQPIHFYSEKTTINYNPDGSRDFIETNNDLEFTKSHQIAAGYDYSITKNLRFKSEVYYQYIFNVPVEQNSSYFSMLNEGGDFGIIREDSLVNEGTGQNYGIEFTFEKFLSDNYYFLITASIFDSKYKGSDGILRNTKFDGNYIFNVLGGYEIKIGKHNSINLDIHTTYSGGKRYIPIDLQESINEREEVLDENSIYIKKMKDYLRIDFRIGFVEQRKRATHEFALDITNIINHDNIYSYYYDDYTRSIKITPQQGFFPMGLYRLSF